MVSRQSSRFLALAAFVIPALGQEADKTSAPAGSYVDHWSAHHVGITNPGTREDAVNNGTLDKWLEDYQRSPLPDANHEAQHGHAAGGCRPESHHG